jgi:hypothetical protein
MAKKYGFIFHTISNQLDLVQSGCSLLEAPKNKRLKTEHINATLRTALPIIKSAAIESGLRSSATQADRMVEMVASENIDYGKLKTHAAELARRIGDDLCNEWFVHIKPSMHQYYFGKELFGPDVAQKFQSAGEDIENAGKCLALSQNTAVVFHLMRAMETAVSALCSFHNIQNSDGTWGQLLQQLDQKIKALPKGANRDTWSECHANLHHVKQAWRNNTMHPKATYTSEQAEEVFQATRVFMKQLATLV